MSLQRLLGGQSDGKKELSMQQVIAKLAEAVRFYSKRKDLGQKIRKSAHSPSGRLLNEPAFTTEHEGLFVRLPDLGAGEFAIKMGTASQVFCINRSSSCDRAPDGQPLIGGSSSSSTTLSAYKIRELRDEQALAIYCSLCAMAVEDAKALKASLPKVKKESKKRGLDKDDPLGATGRR